MNGPSEADRRDQRRIWASDPDVHGSARWASAAHLAERGYGVRGRHTLGYLPPATPKAGAHPLTYGGDRHEMIVAPTRGGKGVSGAIPRLLEHPGSAIVLDIKDGELALITALYRRDVLGQTVLIIDPFDIAASKLGFPVSSFNPLEGIEPFGDDAFDDAMLAADACVIPDGGGENHWSGEAAALIAGLILHLSEHGKPTLGGVRAALNSNKEEFGTIVETMLDSDFDLVRAAGGRIDNKEERELSSVVSTAHRNTHFLESAALARSLASSDVDLTTFGENTTIYIVLPARRIRTAKQWLRLLVGATISAITALPRRPTIPVMFLLEEMAALDRLPITEQAVALMAGYGMQFVMVLQDFTQLRDLYRDRWETFLANSATIQCFGTNDRFTAEYLSSVCGQTSIEQLSHESAQERSFLLGDPGYRSAGDSIVGRRLITADELMSLHPSVQLVKLAGARPVIGYRPVYFLDARFRRSNGQPLFAIHPHHAHRRLPKPISFTAPRLDLGRALAPYLNVG